MFAIIRTRWQTRPLSADNELAARGSWDPDLLRSELGDLKFDGFDLDLIGFEPDRLDEILTGLGRTV
jgi:hypothetical protein